MYATIKQYECNTLAYVDARMCTAVNLALTIAGLHTLKPAVLYVSVADNSTILVPRTTRSATTDSTGSLERAAVWTYRNCRDDDWRGK